VGTLGVGIMNLTAFSLSANSNSKVDGNQIFFGTVDSQTHPPAFTPVFASLDQGIDLTIGSPSFCVVSLGSIRLSDQTKSNQSANKTITMVVSESSGCSSSKVNSPVSVATIRIEDKVDELDEIMGNLDLGKAVDRLDLDQEDFTI
jgi:hypothetical protein